MKPFHTVNIIADNADKTVMATYTSSRPIFQQAIEDLKFVLAANENLAQQISDAQAGKFDRKAGK